MMLCEITTKVLYHDRLGELRRGQTVELPDAAAQDFAQRGWVRVYETKVVVSQPTVQEPVAPKRGRPRKA